MGMGLKASVTHSLCVTFLLSQEEFTCPLLGPYLFLAKEIYFSCVSVAWEYENLKARYQFDLSTQTSQFSLQDVC